MKHAVIFLALIFSGSFAALYWKKQKQDKIENIPILRVYASSSFMNQWGPGPWLREKFEAVCGCRVEYTDSVDTTTVLQRLKTEPRHQAADVVIGFDQLDLEWALKSNDWKPLTLDTTVFEEELKPFLNQQMMVPYDWGVISFVGRRSQLSPLPTRFQDLLSEALRNQISLQDPRTSSVGLEFLLWLIKVKGEDAAFQYLRKLNNQIKAYGTNWSMSYGLFQKNQVQVTLSYVTSPVFHLVEDKNNDVVALEFLEGHPIQVEFAGVSANCRNCDLAQKFILLLLSDEGQKVVMSKNYMFPVRKGVREGSVFAQVPKPRLLPTGDLPSMNERERLLRRWTQVRRAE